MCVCVTQLFCSQSVISTYCSFIAKYCQNLEQRPLNSRTVKPSIDIAFRAQGDTARGHIHAPDCLPAPRARLPPPAARDLEQGDTATGLWSRSPGVSQGTVQPRSVDQAEKLEGSGLGLLRAAGFATRLLFLNTFFSPGIPSAGYSSPRRVSPYRDRTAE